MNPDFTKIPVKSLTYRSDKCFGSLRKGTAFTDDFRHFLMESQPKLNPLLLRDILAEAQHPGDLAPTIMQQMIVPQDPQPGTVTGHHIHVANL